MKVLVATALLIGLSSFTAAQAEWEDLDPTDVIYAGNVQQPAVAVTPAVVLKSAGVPACTPAQALAIGLSPI